MSFLNQGGYNLMRHLIRGKHAQSHSKPAVLFALLATLTLAGCEGSSPSSSAQRTSTSLSPESAEATFFNPCEVLSAEDFAEMGLVRTKDPVTTRREKMIYCGLTKLGKDAADGFYMVSSDDLDKERISQKVTFIDSKFKNQLPNSYTYEINGSLMTENCEAAIETSRGRLSVSAGSMIPNRELLDFCEEAHELLVDLYKKSGG
ncbi:hypothetical protein FRC0129_01737 [Corynebacterium diphtheriae]|uniref:DUF3558 domain-containing protein n=3 Tax=Corynebacterium diphtheriae TaxID=1717 RepID=UPI0013C9BAD1|nr:DUF3558 domain-containing protein [Corynebacterium diphtheriae]UEB75890.1 DUF3558 domain-containing protein [Corynebacterium diphtheriae]CAB0516137.1 hypothetical protein CIP103987_01583 [Corynebacterium diphtheriae]CAB0561255.1 hypothetical protein CIP107526_01580 [Corynebacterium diphtheriae]CAB0610398.1 hypothetical protein CIP107549_01723 [Corynebacterium diphtheriae]CAB0702409.1 hypothetical protein FRC0037_01591 [Corynebacterium diphtheriae]